MTNKISMIKGQRFGKLRFIKELPKIKHVRRGLFKCDCGNKKDLALFNVNLGNTISCGCYRKERFLKLVTKHGIYQSDEIDKKLYNVWNAMHHRCYDPNNVNYKNYHSRGITVSSVWHGSDGALSFVTWAKNNGYKEGLELDRRDNDKGYSPKNCRFVTHKRNTRNMCKTIRIRHPKSGKNIALIDYYEEYTRTISYEAFKKRFRKGKYPHLKIA